MEKNYNYTRSKMFLPEYGRHIHEMIAYLRTIADRKERTRQAYIVIDVMGNLNPLLRDTSDIAHKLWDHLFIMADFNLDVDSPYPIPTQKDLCPNPEKLEYPKKDMMFKHYGKSVERMINSLRDNPDTAAVEATLEDIARYMRTKSYEYNQEHPNNEIIISDIKRMSKGGITIDEEAIGSLKSEYKHAVVPSYQKKGGGKGQYGGKNQKNGRTGGSHNGGGHKMKKFFIMTAIMLGCFAGVSCNRESASLRGHFIGAVQQPVYLERVIPGLAPVADTVVTDARGEFRFKVSLPDRQPTIFNLRYGSDMVPLLISPREKVSVMSFGDLERGYRVSGSAESELVARVHDILTGGVASLDSISGIFAMGSPDDERQRELTRAYFDEYFRIKREQIRFIVENSSSLAAVYALYQRLPGDDVLFNGDSDYVYYQMVADSVHRRYPDSRYVIALEKEVAARTAGADLRNSLSEGIPEVDYPDIELPNMYGQKVRLSSLAGKVIVLDFWSATIAESRINNAEMKELWAEYADRGLAVYQVSLDTSKPVWVNAVQEQKLPWVTVCDFRGEATMGVRLYNIGSIPANFVIDGEGNIVGKNIYGEALARKIAELI